LNSKISIFIYALCILFKFTALGQSSEFSGSITNLGDTPWKFHKIVTKPVNITPQSQVTFKNRIVTELSDNKQNTTLEFPLLNEPLPLVIDFGILRNIQSVKIILGNSDIDSLYYTIEGAADNSLIWGFAVDFSKTPQISISQNIPVVNSTGKTFGYTEKPDYKFNIAEFNGLFRFLKITFYQGKNGRRYDKAVSVAEVEVLVADEKSKDEAFHFNENNFDDNKWQDVGIPHCFNDSDTYLNSYETNMWKGEVWYRKHFFIDKKDSNKQFYLEFEGVNIGTAVYINGVFKKGNTSVPQTGEVTHVGGFIPFSVDISDDIKFGCENIIAVRVSNSAGSFFTWPGFGVFDGFGMGWGGIVSPVYLHKMSKVHIPINAFAASGKWGTYQDAVSANENEAKLCFQTCIENQSSKTEEVVLQTELYDQKGNRVLILNNTQKNIQAKDSQYFKQEAILTQPQLWYPNNSPYGKPYLYKVVRNVLLKGKIIDKKVELMGIREITWDDEYCYINHKKHFIQGFGYRNVYPALGSAVPAELQWKDISLIADCGGNAIRVGHVPPTSVMMEACDAYGIMVILNSGDNEWSLKNEPAVSYKKEYDRNAIISFRSHPSLIVWESNNGIAEGVNIYQPETTQSLVDEWDNIQPRIVLCRDSYPKIWAEKKPIVVGYTNEYKKVKGSPCLDTEVYGANWEGRASWNIARSDYKNEKRFSSWYVKNYLSDIENKACGWIDWMLTETQGEGYTIYLNGIDKQKSLGSSAMDANRFPKLKYRIYEKALWVQYEKRPGVALQSCWNIPGVQDIDAWSNCPYVELFINGKSWGTKEPDNETKQCTWDNLIWNAGKVQVFGLDKAKKIVCSDSIETSGDPYAIVLDIDKPLTTPAGKTFPFSANGSDVQIVTARVVDIQGRWCPFAENLVTFNVEGEGVYCGSSDFYITKGKPAGYHAPFDEELQMEGGLRRVAIRSTFKPGIIIVGITSPGLKTGQVEIESHIINN
jgi:hypothetical protein